MKFNLLSKLKNQTVNYAGAKAFTLSPEMELYTAVVTWSLNDSFYEKDEVRGYFFFLFTQQMIV